MSYPLFGFLGFEATDFSVTTLSFFASTRFLKITLLLWGIGLILALVVSPPDSQQGEGMRILYVHVPASWFALGVLTLMAGASALFLIFRMPRADILAETLAPLGTLMTCFSLTTGALWGKPMWGAFWVWDARLTSMLILLFLYGGILSLRRAFSTPFAAQQPVALLTLVAWLNVPLIKGSVHWFHTLHQPPSLLKTVGPTLHPQMLFPLLVMSFAFAASLLLLTAWRMQMIQARYKMLARTQRACGQVLWERSG